MITTYFYEKSGKRRKGINLICQECNKPFVGPAKERYKFCSKACGDANKRGPKVTITCTYCGKKVQKNPSRLANSKHKIYFCTRTCKDSAQRLGPDCVREIIPTHYNRAVGAVNINEFINRAELAQCCDCKEDRRYLLFVHHIDGHNYNNIATNLEIVCGSCHIRRHLKCINGIWIYDSRCLTPRELLHTV
jgi:endogenous inhibitor of DNA gyrase (YacG/DUF329 family)